MRLFRLLQVALQAELLRWRSTATRIAMRVAFASIALLFLVAFVAFVHLVVWIWLRATLGFGAYAAAGIMAGGDLLVAILFGMMAMRSTPNRVELEAMEVRRRAMFSFASAFRIGQVVIPLLRILNTLLRRART